MRRLALLIVIFTGLTVFVVPSPAAGYVVPARFVIEKMLEAMDLPRGLRVEQELRIYVGSDADGSGAEAKKEKEAEEKIAKAFVQQVKYRLPGAFRSDIENPQLHRIHVFYRGESITVIDGSVVPGGPAWHTCYKDLFLFSSRRPMVKHLEGLGIDMDEESLGRMDKNLVYVLGARFPDKSRQQIWVDKSTFRPVRWIVTPAEDPEEPPVHEIRYPEWQQAGNKWYPGLIEFYENGKKTRAMVVEKVRADTGLTADLFDISVLRKAYAPSAPQEPREDDTGGEIRKEIEEFENIFED